MKKSIYVLAFIGFLAFSCSEDQDPIKACNVDNVMDLPWLQEKIEQYQAGDNTVTIGKYQSQTVFVVTTCCAVCNMFPPPVFDCAGAVIGTIGYEQISLDDITDRKVVWRSEDTSCGMG
jgi:hypothetical protein